jgi:hypothetical protein
MDMSRKNVLFIQLLIAVIFFAGNFFYFGLSVAAASVIETQIDGDFNGWDGETVVKLMNGQVWQQSEYYYHYHYAYNPKVFIFQSGSVWKMQVNGVPKPVGVQRLR